MNSRLWPRVEELFHQAASLAPAQRAAFLEKACAGDAELRGEVESLLAHDAVEDDVLGPAVERAVEQLPGDSGGDGDLAGATTLTEPGVGSTPLLPTVIGRYRILRLVGEGGMGAVYEAEQEHPRRFVALKVIKPGRASPELLRRFEQESQALGRLQHPGIAQIYEAGTADNGFGPQPYFAMEFIRGQSLRDYAEAHALNARQRLVLVAQISEAVHHAHQRGLIHRDLKPGNILVDEAGQPKILDFGVARVTDSDTQATRQTDVGQLVGTLAYMSPEQVLADPLELDTRSDVYALGVILYELLTGRLPYTLSRNLHEAMQTIREKDPSRLSSINRNYRGDIETIVARALEKDKARRYASAAGLAADIRRYLADEPITARPASTGYQLQKFTRRHKTLVGGVAAVFIVMIAGVVTSTWEATRARSAEQTALSERDRAARAERAATQDRDRALSAEQAATTERNRAVAAEAQAVQERNRAVGEKQRADGESATATAVNAFLQNDLLAQASANVQTRSGTKPDPDLKVRTALDRAAGRITGKFDKQPLVEAAIRQTMARTYRDLGLYPEAQRQMERALDLRQRVLGTEHPETLSAMNDMAVLYRYQANYAQAEWLFSKALEARRRVLGEEHPDTLDTMNGLAMLYRYQGKYPQAEPIYKKVIEGRRRALGDDHPNTLDSMNNLAVLYSYQGKYAPAEPLYTKVLEGRRRVLGKEHPDTLTSLANLAQLYGDQGKNAQAEPLFTEALEYQRRVLGEEHPDRLTTMNNLALVYQRDGQYGAAEPLFTRVLEVSRRVMGGDHPNTVITMNNLALVYQYRGQFDRAEPLFTKVVEVSRRTQGEEHPTTLGGMQNLATLYRDQGKYAQAEPLYTKVLEARRRVPGGEDNPSTLKCMHNLAVLYRSEGKYEQAEPLFIKVLDARQRVLGEEHPDTLDSMEDMSLLYHRQGKYAQAERLFGKVLEMRRRVLGPQHRTTTRVLASLGEFQLDQKKYSEAAVSIRAALSGVEKADTDTWRAYKLQSMLGASLAGEKKYDEAEALLLSGQEGILKWEATIPAESKYVLQQAGSWIVQLYLDWGKPGKAAEWREKLRQIKPSIAPNR